MSEQLANKQHFQHMSQSKYQKQKNSDQAKN